MFGQKQLHSLATLFAVILVGVLASVSEAQRATKPLGPDKIYMRFTNTRPDKAKARVRVNVVTNTNKPIAWGKTVYVGASGMVDSAKEMKNPDQWLAAGQSSPWLDIGQYMTLRGPRSPETYLAPVLCGVETSPSLEGLYLTVEIATGKGTGLIRRVTVAKPNLPAISQTKDFPWILGYGVWNRGNPFVPTLGLMVPTRPDLISNDYKVYTLEEAMDWQLSPIKQFPAIGREPTQFIFTTVGRPPILDALGYNDGKVSGLLRHGIGDEISLNHVPLTPEERDPLFREAMKKKGLNPLDLMSDADAAKAKAMPTAEQWQFVHVTPPLPDKPEQYYESSNFSYELWYQKLREERITFEKANADTKDRIVVGANFSSSMVFPDTRQWIGPFRDNSLTMVWSEDWWFDMYVISPQIDGYLLSAMRLAHSYHNAPIQFLLCHLKASLRITSNV